MAIRINGRLNHLNNIRYRSFETSIPNTDPFWNNVIFLSTFDGTDGSTTFTDLSTVQNVLSAVGSAQLDTSQSKFGTASLLLDGNGDYVSMPDNASWDLSNLDFTVEAHIRLVEAPTDNGIIAQRTSTNGWSFNIRNNSGTHQMLFLGRLGASDRTFTQNTTFSIGVWHHVVWVRSSDQLYMFQDGVLLGTPENFSGNVHNHTSDVLIGNRVARYFEGNIDNIRFTKGVARYTSNFTPPSESYPTTS